MGHREYKQFFFVVSSYRKLMDNKLGMQDSLVVIGYIPFFLCLFLLMICLKWKIVFDNWPFFWQKTEVSNQFWINYEFWVERSVNWTGLKQQKIKAIITYVEKNFLKSEPMTIIL